MRIDIMGEQEELVVKLGLIPHPEGGFYKETYRSEEVIHSSEMEGERSMSTAIYFMLTAGNFSAFHRIKSDEMWHFYKGASVRIHVINPNGAYETILLGDKIEEGENLQAIVPAGFWFASETTGEFSLVGCTVSPGFDFRDFELADKANLTKQFPLLFDVIEKYTRV